MQQSKGYGRHTVADSAGSCPGGIVKGKALGDATRTTSFLRAECSNPPPYAGHTLGGRAAGFLLLALRPRVTIVAERGLAAEFMMEYRRARQIAM